MSQKFPVNGEFNEDFTESYNKESDEGYFLEVDIQYPWNILKGYFLEVDIQYPWNILRGPEQSIVFTRKNVNS